MFDIIQHCADFGGCGHYRMRFPAWAAQTLRRDIRIVDSTRLIPIPQFYQGIRMLRLQRQVNDPQCQFVMNFFKPVSEKVGMHLCYEIDDVIGMDDIPKYNKGWAAFQSKQFMENIKTMMKACDLVTVTCEELKKYYVYKFEVPKENVIILPNYLPRWWIGDCFYPERISNRFDNNQKKPRIGFFSSTTHFDIENKNEGVDDFTHILDFINQNVDKYHFIFVGGIPLQISQLAKERKVEVWPGFDLLNYPREANNLNIDLVIAPLKDNIFNRCKSNIKFLEMSAMGIPCICQDLDPYRPYTNLLFRDCNELSNHVDKLLSNKTLYMDTILKNRNTIDHGDKNAPKGWWLEKNMDKWYEFYTIGQKTLRFDLSKKEGKEFKLEDLDKESKKEINLGDMGPNV